MATAPAPSPATAPATTATTEASRFASREIALAARDILEIYPERRGATIPLLNLVQSAYGWISAEAIEWVAEQVGQPTIKIQEVISFYTLFHTKPVGRHHLRVCRTLSCALLGQEPLSRHLRKKVGSGPGEVSADGRISWEEVECLGACELAPCVQADDDYHGPVTEEKLDSILARLT